MGIFFISCVGSCEVLDPEEQIPSYIHIDTISLATNYITEGSTASKFTDAWIYIDDQPLGVYELPATIPILQEGTHQFKIRGGIKVNGISSSRAAYPMCNFHIQDVDLKINDSITLTPEVNYFSGVKFRWLEDFENVGVSINTTTASDTSIQITTDLSNVFEGNKSGVVYLDADHPNFECRSSSAFTLPLADVYLELNYKCNNAFKVGIYPSLGGLPYTTLYLNPSNEWNKIYINLVNEIGTANSNPYNIFIAMDKSSDVEFPILYLDNIKLVHQ